jgi:hypothetical protein
MSAIPVYLTSHARWLLWRTETRIDRKTGEKRSTKVPISFHTGKPCDVTAPASWIDYASVEAALLRSRAWDGPGFALGAIESIGEVVIGLDGDNCLDEDGAVAEWFMPFLVAMGSYAEESPSGTGIKCIGRIKRADLAVVRKLLDITEGDKDQARTRIFGTRPPGGGHAPGAQLFLGRRYFAITGRHWVASPEDVTLLSVGQIAQLGVLFGPNEQRSSRASCGNGAASDDDEPDEASLRDKLGAAFVRSPALRERWEGGTQGLNDTTRSGRDMSIVAMLVTAGFTKGETRAALHLFEHGKIADEPERYFEQMWARTKATPRVEPEPPPDDDTKAALPDLHLLGSDLPLVSQRLRDHLARHPWLFERGGPARLVTFPAAVARQAEIHQLGVDATIHAAHEVCRPYRIDHRGKRSDVTLPESVAKLYLALNGRWQLRPLHGICCSVLLEDDGTIHAVEGFHAPSGMWCTQAPAVNVPDRPSKAEAGVALYSLREAMRTFTFKDAPLTHIAGIDAKVVDIEPAAGLCESAALCGLLTAVCRASLPLAPGVMINAPSLSGSGAGKGLLARMMTAIGLGIVAEATAAGHDEAELEKRIATSLLAGDPALLLDNLNNTLLRSAQLESCLTEPVVSVRVFGHLKKEKLRANAFVVVTGNGLQAGGDAARRYVYPTLVPPVDNPEQRRYPPGFLDRIIARRGELLSACLTIWRWGRQQNLPRGLPFGSYEKWGAWVRDPLLALGCADPVEGVQETRERDPGRVSIAALFEAWSGKHGGWVRADDLDPTVRRLVDEKDRPAAIRQRLNELVGTRLGGFQLLGKADGNGKHRKWTYCVVPLPESSPSDAA